MVLLLHPILASVISWSAFAAPACAGLGRGRGTVCAAAPVIEEYDVVVIGAGIAGASAAAPRGMRPSMRTPDVEQAVCLRSRLREPPRADRMDEA